MFGMYHGHPPLLLGGSLSREAHYCLLFYLHLRVCMHTCLKMKNAHREKEPQMEGLLFTDDETQIGLLLPW